MLCNAIPRDKKKKKKKKKRKKEKRTMVTKGKAMKHKNYIRKTQLDRVFCIQNLLDAP